MSRIRSALALTGAATTLVLGCKIEPETPELVYSLNTNALAENEALAADPSALAQLDGALRMLFGTPGGPAFLALEEWLDDEFDPNYWTKDQADEALWQELIASNKSWFRRQLAKIEDGDFEGVPFTRYAPELWQDWSAHMDKLFTEFDGDPYAALPDPFEGYDGTPIETWVDEAKALFHEYYPSLETSAEMYRQQCYHCHGASGGGDGSTAPYLNPRPRDYRPGKFKFTALADKARPRHSDLRRILREGIYTTSMPSFARFPESMRSGLADYVRLLSIRGETELLVSGDFDDQAGFSLDSVLENYRFTVERWRGNDDKVIRFDDQVPEATEERIVHGKELFQSETGANCIKCHGAMGRGDGASVWEPGKEGVEYAKDDWGNEISPRDLTRGIYRFGRRPIDLYRRIYAGINGTPMPAHYDMQITENGETRRMGSDDIWDLVFYVRALPERSGRKPRWSFAENAGADGHGADGEGAHGDEEASQAEAGH